MRSRGGWQWEEALLPPGAEDGALGCGTQPLALPATRAPGLSRLQPAGTGPVAVPMARSVIARLAEALSASPAGRIKHKISRFPPRPACLPRLCSFHSGDPSPGARGAGRGSPGHGCPLVSRCPRQSRSSQRARHRRTPCRGLQPEPWHRRLDARWQQWRGAGCQISTQQAGLGSALAERKPCRTLHFGRELARSGTWNSWHPQVSSLFLIPSCSQ